MPLLVSAIIPTYNRSELVMRAVQSVLNQTYSNIEVIVVDDASTDDTHERLAVFSDRIHYVLIPHQAKAGGPARNVGIEASRGDYLAFLDSDDEWLPDKIAKQVAVLDNPDIHVVYCDAVYLDDDGNILRLQRERYRGNILSHLFADNIISGSASAVMLRRSCFAKVSLFRTDLVTRDDWDLWIRLAFHFSFDFVPEPLVRIHIGANNIQSTYGAAVLARSLSELYEGLLTNPETREYVLRHWRECQSAISYFVGGNLYWDGDLSAARRAFLRSVRWSPIQKRAYIQLIKTFLPPGLVSGLKRIRSQLTVQRQPKP
jgi:glycosyltransferase involved in cell wall biosynthesis